ncbi:MAG: helix-turn-helix domain-containing protein [Solirubrobacterales bacterium]
MDFGERFRAAREKLQLSLEQVEDETKIRKLYLIGLEQNDFSNLPARVYAVGFVKRYSRLLGLNEEEMAQEFVRLAYKSEAAESALEQQTNRTFGAEVAVTWKEALAGVVFIAVIGMIGYLAYDVFSPGPGTAHQPKTRHAAKAPKPEKQTKQQTAPQMITLHVYQKSWVGVSTDAQPVFAGNLAMGDEKRFQAQERIDLRIGNAGGVKVIYNGKDLGFLGTPWQVIRATFPPPPPTAQAATAPTVTIEPAAPINRPKKRVTAPEPVQPPVQTPSTEVPGATYESGGAAE